MYSLEYFLDNMPLERCLLHWSAPTLACHPISGTQLLSQLMLASPKSILFSPASSKFRQDMACVCQAITAMCP
jgi:hypothetical protein